LNLHEKTKDYELSACPNVECNVVTFIRSDVCPGCGAQGLLLRWPIDGRGLPTRMAEGATAETG
jgi:hypothetical protein